MSIPPGRFFLRSLPPPPPWNFLAVFVLSIKIHALLLSNSRAAVLETAFFFHGNCCQLFQSTFPNFSSVKLGIYCCRQADVNNIILSVRLEEFQLFKVLRSTIDNHRDSGLHSVITLSRKDCIYRKLRNNIPQGRSSTVEKTGTIGFYMI